MDLPVRRAVCCRTALRNVCGRNSSDSSTGALSSDPPSAWPHTQAHTHTQVHKSRSNSTSTSARRCAGGACDSEWVSLRSTYPLRPLGEGDTLGHDRPQPLATVLRSLPHLRPRRRHLVCHQLAAHVLNVRGQQTRAEHDGLELLSTPPPATPVQRSDASQHDRSAHITRSPTQQPG
jgi:hypothetical protein